MAPEESREVIEAIIQAAGRLSPAGAKLEIVKTVINLGGAVVVAMFLVWVAYRLLAKYGTAFIGTQEKMAEAMGRQAQCMSDMKETVCEFVGRDSGEHREIILGLQVVGKELKTLTNQVARLSDGYEEDKK